MNAICLDYEKLNASRSWSKNFGFSRACWEEGISWFVTIDNWYFQFLEEVAKDYLDSAIPSSLKLRFEKNMKIFHPMEK